MNILVTGGAGFIGSHLVDALVALGHAVYVYDNLDPQVHMHGLDKQRSQQPPAYLDPRSVFIYGDVRDRAALAAAIHEHSVEAVYHLAARVGVGQSMYEIERYTAVNAGGTATLMDVLANAEHSVEKVVIASSNLVYGEGAYRCSGSDSGSGSGSGSGPNAACDRRLILEPLTRIGEQLANGQWELTCPRCGARALPAPTPEAKQAAPASVYALSKRYQEDLAMVVGRAYGIATTAARFFNVYGPRQALDNPYTGVFGIFVARVANGKPPVLYEDGEQTRDLVHVSDIVQGLVKILGSAAADQQRINLGSGTAVSVRGLAQAVIDGYDARLEPEVLHRYRAGDIRHCYADISKARGLLGYEPKVAFRDGIQTYLDWARARSQPAVDRFAEASAELARRGLV